MKKISIKREQSQAGLSFAEREKFRPQVKNKLLLLLVLLMTAATGAWAQTTINVTADDLGKAVCTDGSIYANVSAAQSAGKTAVAKIICLDTQNSKALALSLDNQAVPPAEVNNATAQSRCEALNTTRAVTFGTWVLPSKAQWEAMIEAAGGYTALRDGFGIIFGGNQLEQVLYWSSTAGTTGHWRINFYDGKWDDNTGESSARACLVINLPQTYSVTLNDGTENPTTWTASTDGTNFGALPIGGLKGDGSETVTLKYNGRLKVKSVTATTDAAPAVNPNAYLKWDATKKELMETEIPAEVTTVTSSTTTWPAGTYVVEGEVTISSQITITGDVNLIIKDGAKLTANKISGNSNNLSIYGQANQTGQLVVNCSGDAIVSITKLEVHSCQVKSTSSAESCGGFYRIDEINVYGGSVDAEYTATQGYGILLTDNGKMNIYGGDVKAEGSGNGYSFGIRSGYNGATVTVHGGTLWAKSAANQAIGSNVTLNKGDGFTGKIETSDNGTSWTEHTSDGTPSTKYVRVGY